MRLREWRQALYKQKTFATVRPALLEQWVANSNRVLALRALAAMLDHLPRTVLLSELGTVRVADGRGRAVRSI